MNNQVFKRSQVAELKLHMPYSSLKNKLAALVHKEKLLTQEVIITI